MYTQIGYQQEGPLLWLVLKRSEARNALNTQMVEELLAALEQAEQDPEIRCLILTGEGESFCAGGDLKKMRAREGMFAGDPTELRGNYIRGLQRIPRRLALFDKPIIAAINGAAIGAGLDLACMCDIRIASEEAIFGSTFVRVGLVPGDGGAYLLSRTVGFSRALELMLTGRVIEAREAERIGLIHHRVPSEELSTEARRHGEQLAQSAPIAMQLSKRSAYRSWDMDLDRALELAASYQALAQHTQDHQEAVNALLEGRSPRFGGH